MAFATDRLFSEYIYVPSYTTSTSISANISITRKIKDASIFVSCGSLVEGYTIKHRLEFHPFSIELEKLLSHHLKCNVKVDTMGVSGECVIPTMAARLQAVLSTGTKKYDWIIILGGTNDLGMGADGEKLLSTLCSMHDNARASGAHTACLAVPQIAVENEQNLSAVHDKKLKVNDGLRRYCECSGGQSIFVDLYNELPHPAKEDPERNVYWCDMLHLTERGYDVMANIIFSALKEHLVDSSHQ